MGKQTIDVLSLHHFHSNLLSCDSVDPHGHRCKLPSSYFLDNSVVANQTWLCHLAIVQI
jgi:hypothetical protein